MPLLNLTIIIFQLLLSTECREFSYFYKDLCYDECPQRTYAKVNADTLDDLDADNEVGTPEVPGSTPEASSELPSTGNGLIDKDDPLQASERRRRSESAATLTLTPRHSQICDSCDPSCLRCYGPNVSQCSTCPPGSQLRKLSQTNETYCYAYVVRSTIDSSNEELEGTYKVQYMQLTTALLVIAVVVSIVGVAVAGAMVYHRRAKKDEMYSRVSLMAEDESDEDNEEDIFTARKKSPFDVVEYHDYCPPQPSEVLEAVHQTNADEEE